jgi:hypothetical protein
MTLSIKGLYVILAQVTLGMTMLCHYAECRYAECRYDECRYDECRDAVVPAALPFWAILLNVLESY